MREAQLESIEVAVERDLALYLGRDGRVSATKLAAFHSLHNMASYAAKAYVERAMDRLAREPELGGSPDKPLSYQELAVKLKDEINEADKFKVSNEG